MKSALAIVHRMFMLESVTYIVAITIVADVIVTQ